LTPRMTWPPLAVIGADGVRAPAVAPEVGVGDDVTVGVGVGGGLLGVAVVVGAGVGVGGPTEGMGSGGTCNDENEATVTWETLSADQRKSGNPDSKNETSKTAVTIRQPSCLSVIYKSPSWGL
jgi:hypothetical protein